MRRDELKKLIQGSICTLPAPFDENHRADYGRMYELCKFLVDQGLRTGNSVLKVAAAGGEGSQLADDEWAAMVQSVVSAADGKVPVMAGISHKDTYRTIEDAKKAQDLGAVGLQISPPIFNDPKQDDLLRHYSAISDGIEIGVMVYNTPWFSMQMGKRYGGGGIHSLGDHHPDTIVKMADFEHIVAIKWSVSDDYEYEEMTRFAHIFNVLDNNTDPMLCHKLGGRGYINTFNDAYPAHDIEIWNLMESGRYEEAQKLYMHPRTPEMAAFSAKVMAKSGGIARIKKGIMEVMGQPVGAMRPPSLPLMEEEVDELREIVRSWGWPVVESKARQPVAV